MSLRCGSQFAVFDFDSFSVHLNVVFDFSITICFSLNSNGSCIAVGKLHAFAGRNNALRRACIIFDGKALVDVSIEIGQRATHVGCSCRIEFGCTAACGIRCRIAFKHIIRRQRYCTLIVCRINAHSRAAAQCIGNRFGDIARTCMKRVKLAAINRVGGSCSDFTWCDMFKLTLIASRTERNLRTRSNMCRSRKTAVSNTIDCRSRYSRCIGISVRTRTDGDRFILTGSCARAKRCCTKTCGSRTRTKGSRKHPIRIGFYTDCNGGMIGSRTLKGRVSIKYHFFARQRFINIAYFSVIMSRSGNQFISDYIPIVATDSNR